MLKDLTWLKTWVNQGPILPMPQDMYIIMIHVCGDVDLTSVGCAAREEVSRLAEEQQGTRTTCVHPRP